MAFDNSDPAGVPSRSKSRIDGVDSCNAQIMPVVPVTSQKPTANSAKKRRRVQSLTRSTVSPSRNIHMAAIFQDAATSFRGLCSPRCPPSSNMKRARKPFSQARTGNIRPTVQEETTLSPPAMNISKTKPPPVTPFEPAVNLHEPHHHQICTFTASQTALRAPIDKPDHAGYSSLAQNANLTSTALSRNSTNPQSHTACEFQMHTEVGHEKTASSRFSTSIAAIDHCPETPEEVQYPKLDHWQMPQPKSLATTLGSDNEDCHSCHGASLTMPFPNQNNEAAHRASIETWLNDVTGVNVDALRTVSPLSDDDTENHAMDDAQSSPPSIARTAHQNSYLAENESQSSDKCPSGASSNKENISPSKSTRSSIRLPNYLIRSATPLSFRDPIAQATPLQSAGKKALSASRSHRPLSPMKHLPFVPTRKKPRLDDHSTHLAKRSQGSDRKIFTIHDDQLAEALSQLSPSVERHRKGRGPKRERCISYWDEDILQPGSRAPSIDPDGIGLVAE